MTSPTSRSTDDPELARWGLLALSLVIGAFLMTYYVQLLHESVARGHQWRYSQTQGTSIAAAESTGPGQIRRVGTQP